MKSIFVIMPIRPNTDPVWEQIEPAIASNPGQFVAQRADLDQNAFVIEGIFRAIDRAAAVVVDLTPDLDDAKVPRWNPNVLFEFGYAVAKRVPGLLVCAKTAAPQRFPFDIAHQRVHFYSSTRQLRELIAAFDFHDSEKSQFAGSSAREMVAADAMGTLAGMMFDARRELAKDTNDYFLFLRGRPRCAERFLAWCIKRLESGREQIKRAEREADEVAGEDARNLVSFAIGTQKVKIGFLEDLLANVSQASDEDDLAWWLAKSWASPTLD